MPDITLIFKGQEYILPEEKAFEAGEPIERIAKLPEVLTWYKLPEFNRMSRCYAIMLGHAGCRVTAREVHREMMKGFKAGNPGTHYAALMALIHVLMDGAPAGDNGDSDAGKQAAAS